MIMQVIKRARKVTRMSSELWDWGDAMERQRNDGYCFGWDFVLLSLRNDFSIPHATSCEYGGKVAFLLGACGILDEVLEFAEDAVRLVADCDTDRLQDLVPGYKSVLFGGESARDVDVAALSSNGFALLPSRVWHSFTPGWYRLCGLVTVELMCRYKWCGRQYYSAFLEVLDVAFRDSNKVDLGYSFYFWREDGLLPAELRDWIKRWRPGAIVVTEDGWRIRS